ncbi:sensor histidine kinase [Demequina lutea]|uniref:histidine kinase n=1 Tax=Demequina lutea TaxID=431489 RepID=A0A7Y9Z9M9_9MICO|nr:HAMP domain-containing sensor histidine kinase [Demequina lutea]NYI40563.1 two-component system OmpR family sensor kinase [Demequina lutea]
MRSWPLKWTIPAIALVLVLLTEFVIGASVLLLLHRTLTSQVDRKLDDAVSALASHPAAIVAIGNSGTAAGMPLQPPNDVVVVVFRADGSEATAATQWLNNGRPLPPITLRPNATATYTARAPGESWRVVTRHLEATGPGAGTTIAVMAPLRDIGSAATILGRGIIVLGLAVALLAAALAAWATRRSLRPLAEAERTAASIAAGDLTRRVPSYPRTTEAGSLAASLNAMLDRLSATMTQRDASEAKLRLFVSDASHELRTPLAAIRGYAELHRMGADETGQAIARIEANADRMAKLVDDLLLLARSDEAAAVLGGNEDVDIAHVLDDVAADVRAQDSSRMVTVAAEQGTVVRGSTRHLTQLFSNVAANALRHTPEGTPIELTARVEGDRVVATVRDHGPGFGAAHAARAFERFYRADESRTRASGGSGLGLAIVAAIASAHGGSAVASDIGPADAPEGAIVTVTLPASPA